MLCFDCAELSFPLEDSLRRVWSSFDALVTSADSGCDLCDIVRHWLANWESVRKLKGINSVIELSSGHEAEAIGISWMGRWKYVPLDKDSDNIRIPVHQHDNGVFACAKQWLSECISHHPDCKGENLIERRRRTLLDPEFLSILPKRLLDLSHGENLIILDCAEWVHGHLIQAEQLTEYCTLSYRWGDTAHTCTLQKGFDTMLELHIQAMPNTFKDAITVARKLGIRFLWIDALCIVQPTALDKSEWLEEGSRMGLIYENAICTIAANSAKNADEGFLRVRERRYWRTEPCRLRMRGFDRHLYVPTGPPRFSHFVSGSLLNQRGWVVQERALSRRILHFTENGLFWECACLKAHEVYGTVQDRANFPSCPSRESLLSVTRARQSTHLCPVEWFHFIKTYSSAGFTNVDDRLLALGSVAKAVQPIIGGHQYVAGLWMNDIMRGLAWRCFIPRARPVDNRALSYGAPSWSWASAKGQVNFSIDYQSESFKFDLVQPVSAEIIPAVASNPFGALIGGRMRLRGTLDSWIIPLVHTALFRILHVSEDTRIYWDEEQSLGPRHGIETDPWETETSRKYTVMPIGHIDRSLMLPGSKEPHIKFGGLVLEPVGDTEMSWRGFVVSSTHEYRRIGWVEYGGFRDTFHLLGTQWDASIKWSGEGWRDQDPVDITLI